MIRLGLAEPSERKLTGKRQKESNNNRGGKMDGKEK